MWRRRSRVPVRSCRRRHSTGIEAGSIKPVAVDDDLRWADTAGRPGGARGLGGGGPASLVRGSDEAPARHPARLCQPAFAAITEELWHQTQQRLNVLSFVEHVGG